MKLLSIIVVLIFLFAGCNSSILDDPSTVINYSLVQRSWVKITVENNYNTVVATLVDTIKNAGYYSANYNSSSLAEGVYYYNLEIKGVQGGSETKITRIMLLVK